MLNSKDQPKGGHVVQLLGFFFVVKPVFGHILNFNVSNWCNSAAFYLKSELGGGGIL